jgi:hypothetical protein
MRNIKNKKEETITINKAVDITAFLENIRPITDQGLTGKFHGNFILVELPQFTM